MWHLTISSLWSRKRRLLGACTAVVIGVAFLTATLALAGAMRQGYDDLYVQANAGTDVLVRNATELGGGDSGPQRGTIEATEVDRLAGLDGVARAIGQVEGTAQVVGADGDAIGGDGPPTVGTNWIDDPSVSAWHLVAGRAPQAVDEVVIDEASADEGDLAVGATTTVRTGAVHPVTVVGIAAFGDGPSLGATRTTFFTLPAAQDVVLGRAGQVSGVLLVAEPGTSPEALREAISTQLPAGAEALTGAERAAEQSDELGADFLDFFEQFLLAFAGVALLVATFSIHNTFSILVAQRTRESALLRAVGASRRQVVTAVAVEALAIGVVASAVGLVAGLGLATGLAVLMDAAGVGLPESATLALSGGTITAAVVVGIVVTAIASIAPAVKASRIAPLAALRDVAVDRSGASKARAALGVLLTGAGVATVLTATATPDAALARAGVGSLLSVVGMVVLGPVVAPVATRVIGGPLALVGGRNGSLARRNAMRSPKRTSGTAAALMIGTAVVALFATLGSSIKASLDDVVDESFGGDLVIAQSDFSGAPLDRAMGTAIAQLPEVEASAAFGLVQGSLDGDESVGPMAADLDAAAAVLDLGVLEGSMAEVGTDGLAVSEAYASDHGWGLGTDVPLSFADGATEQLEVRAIYEVRGIMGDVLVPRAAWLPHAPGEGDTVVLVALRDGVSVAEGKAAIEPVVERFGGPEVQDRDEYLASVSGQIDAMLGLVYGLLGLAVLIAVLGIANTLSLSLHERTRELGLLRAVGQSRRQLRRTVRWESVIIAVFGTAGGLGLGTFLGWGLVRALSAQEGMGTFAAPVPTLTVVVVLAVVAGVLAARKPAKRAARLDILAAIATD